MTTRTISPGKLALKTSRKEDREVQTVLLAAMLLCLGVGAAAILLNYRRGLVGALATWRPTTRTEGGA